MHELTQYILANKVTKSRIASEIYDTTNRKLPRRHLFVKLKQYADDFFSKGKEPRLLALAGLRGVGKTTLMWQAAEHIFDTQSKEIYFINVDDLNRLGYNLHDVFTIFENEVLKKPFYELENPIVFLIDEVHEAEGWDKDLKILYERCKKSFVVCTGSSALLLHQSPDLASRWSLIHLYPFCFTEFIHSKSWLINENTPLFPQKDLGNQLRQILFYSNDIHQLKEKLELYISDIHDYIEKIERAFPTTSLENLINEYVSYHNIARFLSIENRSLINNRIIDLFERIVLKDIPIFTPIKENDTELLFRLLLRLALSEEINMEKLASSIGCKLDKVENFIDTLNKAEILNVLNPYGGTQVKIGIYKKPFFMSPSLRRALYQRVYGKEIEDRLRAKLYEDIVAMYLKRVLQNSGMLSFGQSKKSVSPDFIVDTADAPIVIEVGMHKTTIRQTEKYLQKKRYGIIISAHQTEYTIKDNTLLIPLSWFLLL